MKGLKDFKIPFVGLKDGNHLFEYQIDNTFFEAFNYNEFTSSNVKVNLDFAKKSTLLELSFTAKGSVHIPCDITYEFFDLEIESNLNLLVKFGSEFNNDNDEILILPHNAFEIDIAQYIYEMIVLAIPSKRVHPDVLNGTMKSEALKKLKQLRVKEIKKTEETDPRWDKLKDLIK